MNVVELQAVSKTFASTGTRALESVDFTLQAGEVHALVGENGAGKSTLARILCGFDKADSGHVLIGGQALHFAGHREAERVGVGFVPQYGMLAEGLSVCENLALGHEPRRFGFIYDRQRARRSAQQLCQRYGFTINVDAMVSGLSAAKRREAEILRALARASQVLVLDEPTTVLSEAENQHLFALIKSLRAEGLAILYISHRAKEILALADRLTVLRDGRVETVRPVAGLDECSLAQLIVRSSACPAFSTPEGQPGPPVLELAAVRVLGRGADSLEALDLQVHAGEIVGVVALGNNGLETLEKVVSGRLLPDAGTVRLAGKLLADWDSLTLRTRLLSYIATDREVSSLCMQASIRDNALAKRLHGFSSLAFAGGKQAASYAEALLADAGIKARAGNPTGSLSGGNRQRLLVARELELASDCLIAANPAQGLDSASRAELLQGIQLRRDAGSAVLLLSSDLEDVAAIADRAYILYRGTLQAIDSKILAADNPAELLSSLLTGGTK